MDLGKFVEIIENRKSNEIAIENNHILFIN